MTGKASGKTPAEDRGLFVKSGILQGAGFIPGKPTLVYDMAQGETVSVGLLRAIECDEAGRAIGVHLEVEDGLSMAVIQGSGGFRLTQGRYADREYRKYVEHIREFIADTTPPQDQVVAIGGSFDELVARIRQAVGEGSDEDDMMGRINFPYDGPKH